MAHPRGIIIPIIDGSGRRLVQVDDDDADGPHVLVVDPRERPQPEGLTRRPKLVRGANKGRRRRSSASKVARQLGAIGCLIATLLVASVAHGQDDVAPDDELTAARLLSDSSEASGPPILRPQLVEHDRKAVVVTGVTASVLGVGALVSSWVVYAARQDYRLRPWTEVDEDVIDGFESRGAWSLWLGVGSAAALVAAEYLLLPEDREVPTLAWLAGGAGLITAAVGLGYTVGGTHCAPQAAPPGATLARECQSSTADALFGPLLMLTAVPLLNIPLTYLLRSLFAAEPDSLSVTPSGLALRAAF